MSEERKETVADYIKERFRIAADMKQPCEQSERWHVLTEAERLKAAYENEFGNIAQMRDALERILQSFAADHYGAEGALSVGEIFALAKSALAAPPRNCDVCPDAQVANARFQKMCDGRGNGLKACTGCKYNDTPDGFPAISRCRVSWPYDTAEVAQ